MALIDRNFQGFGKELFTDAGKYVIHFGDKPMDAAEQASKTIQAAHPDKPVPPVTAVAKYRNPDMQVIATSTADQLVSFGQLALSDVAVARYRDPCISISKTIQVAHRQDCRPCDRFILVQEP